MMYPSSHKPNLITTKASTPAERAQQLSNAYAVLVGHTFSLMILSGIMDIFIARALDKAMRYGIYKMQTKKLLNEAKKYIDKFRSEQRQLEEEELIYYISDATPAFVEKYRNSGGMMIGIQNKWRVNEMDKAETLYVVYLQKLKHHNKKYPDFLSSILMIHLCASMAKLYSQRTIDDISNVFGNGYKILMPSHATANFIISRTMELLNDPAKDISVDYMKTKTKDAVLAFEDSIFDTKKGDTMGQLLWTSVIDYTEFYIAYVVRMMQNGQFTDAYKRKVRKDLEFLDNKGMLYPSCIKDWKKLASSLPTFDDIEDLKETIMESDIKTPGLDRMRTRVRERKIGEKEEGQIEII